MLDTLIIAPNGEEYRTTRKALKTAEEQILAAGWVGCSLTITNIYADGAIRLAEGDGPNDRFRFVRTDGSLTRVVTWASVHATTELREMAATA